MQVWSDSRLAMERCKPVEALHAVPVSSLPFPDRLATPYRPWAFALKALAVALDVRGDSLMRDRRFPAVSLLAGYCL